MEPGFQGPIIALTFAYYCLAGIKTWAQKLRYKARLVPIHQPIPFSGYIDASLPHCCCTSISISHNAWQPQSLSLMSNTLDPHW